MPISLRAGLAVIISALACLLAVLPGPVAAEPAARAQVTPHRVGAIKLGMTKKQAIATGQTGKPQCARMHFNSARKLITLFANGRVRGVLNSNAKLRTAKGIRFGSTLQQTRRAYPAGRLVTFRSDEIPLYAWAVRNRRDHLVVGFLKKTPGSKAFATGAVRGNVRATMQMGC